MIYYKSNKNLLFGILIYNLFFGVVIMLSGKIEVKIILLCWLIMIFPAILFTILGKKIKSIEISEKLTLTFSAFFKSNSNSFEFKNLQYSYKIETGAKGSRASELRIYNAVPKAKIIGLGRGFDGWPDETVFDIIDNLKKVGIKEIE
jgi:hypothetical protein